MTASKFIATSLKEAAFVVGVQPETIRTWISRGCPAEVGTSPDGGTYDIPKMIRWARKNVWVPKQNGSGGSSNREDTKDRILQIELAERTLGLKQKLGELVERQAVLVKVSQMFTNVRNRLQAIPPEAASAVPGHLKTEVITEWERLIHRCLKELEYHAYATDAEDPTDERDGSDPLREQSPDQ